MPTKTPAPNNGEDVPVAAASGFLANWPLVWRLPISTAMLVLVFAVAFTQVGLRALEQRETAIREEVGGAFLDTLAGFVSPAMVADAQSSDLQSLLLSAARFKPSLRNEAVAVCCFSDGSMVLSSSYADQPDGPLSFRQTEVDLRSWVEANRNLQPGETATQTVGETNKKLILRAYQTASGEPLLLAAAFDLEWQRDEQLKLGRTALAVDIGLSLIAALLSFLLVRHSLKPINTLTQSLTGDMDEHSIPLETAGADTEIGRLRTALQSRAELQAKAEAVAKSESRQAREATLARLAAGLAHEVRNPVAGMSAATSTLRRYGDDKTVREQTLDLIDRGLQSIDHVAASMLSTYRPPEGNRDLEPHDLNDLRTLINPKVRVKQVDLTFLTDLSEPFPASAEAVRQIALNLLLNAVDATPAGSAVGFQAAVEEEHLTIRVSDSGSGLPDDALGVLTGVEGTDKPQTRRLGLWLVHQLIDDVNARIAISTRSSSGTVITITIPRRTGEIIDA